jgi:hypothetical protein
MPPNKFDAFATQVRDLTKDLAIRLHGRPVEVQSAVLADLLAVWITGFDEASRARALELHLDMVQRLVPVNDSIIRRRRSMN